MSAPRTVYGYSDLVINDKAFVFSDFENHGYTDILEKAPAMQVGPERVVPQTQYRYFHNNGNGFTEYTYQLSTGEPFVVLDTGDFNGDGALDIIVRPGTNQNWFLLPQKICLSPLNHPGALPPPGSPIVFNCESGWPPTFLGAPYVVDVRGDGRSAVYSSNDSGVVTVCIQGKCQQDFSPPNVLTMISPDDGSPEYAQNQYFKLSQVVDFTGIGKPYDVRWTTVNFREYTQDGTESIYNPHYENLQPTIVLNNFNPPGATTNLGVMANYTYDRYVQPPRNTPYLPYLFDKYDQMGNLAADFNGSGYNSLAFGFTEMANPTSTDISAYSRAELTICLSTGRALDCGVRKKYSGPEYVAIRAVGNFIGDGQATILVDRLNPVLGSRPRPSGDVQMCHLIGDDTTGGAGVDDSNIVCTPWNGFKVQTVANTSFPFGKVYFLDLLGTGRTQIVQYHAGQLDGTGSRWEVFAPIDVAVAGQALDRIHQVTNGVGAVSTVQYVDGMVEGIVSQSG
ncbi:VCBS repeat-containing protein, partial [Undibacterium sp. CY21W]|uniref:FG-GAP repeat domain-containing protein n=1 Tax=Undibacterium sp. CY21W TaxID=2762293 RepID=UPI00164BE90D